MFVNWALTRFDFQFLSLDNNRKQVSVVYKLLLHSLNGVRAPLGEKRQQALKAAELLPTYVLGRLSSPEHQADKCFLFLPQCRKGTSEAANVFIS